MPRGNLFGDSILTCVAVSGFALSVSFRRGFGGIIPSSGAEHSDTEPVLLRRNLHVESSMMTDLDAATKQNYVIWLKLTS